MSPRLPIGVATMYSVPATLASGGAAVFPRRPALMARSIPDADGVAQRRAQELAQAPRDAHLELAHALARNTETIPELLQGERLVRDHALVEDHQVFTAQRLAK